MIMLNLTPDLPFSSSFQYISILELLGSVDMMSRNLPYRKYRPRVHVHTNAYQWSEPFTKQRELSGIHTASLCFRYAHISVWCVCVCLCVCVCDQVALRDNGHHGGRCEAPAAHVVMETHQASPGDGETLPGTLQGEDHQQEAPRHPAQGTGGPLSSSLFQFLLFLPLCSQPLMDDGH